MRVLVFYLDNKARASYYNDWLDAFQNHQGWHCQSINIFLKQDSSFLSAQTKESDVIVLLHSCTADTLHYIKKIDPFLNSRKGKLLSFIGNEYNMPFCPLGEKIEFLKQIQADYVASQLLLETAMWLYADTGANVLSVPHALNQKAFQPTIPFEKRPYILGSRSFAYPLYLGDNERNQMLSSSWNLPKEKVSFSTHERLNRQDWALFLNQCNATLSTEAGSFFIEKDDKTAKKVYEYLCQKGHIRHLPGRSFFYLLSKHLPYSLRSLSKKVLSFLKMKCDANDELLFDLYQDIYERFFKNNLSPVSGKCISSRHFDAIGTKTLQIMFEGRFNNILIPNKHYLVLKKDFSNQKEIISQCQDKETWEQITTNALNFVLNNHTYHHRVLFLETLFRA